MNPPRPGAPTQSPSSRMRQNLARVPQTVQEYLWSLFPPTRYIVQAQEYGLTIPSVLGGTVGQASWPAFPAPIFVFNVAASIWTTATGANLPFPVRFGVAYTTGNNWTSGNFANTISVFNGGGGGGFSPSSMLSGFTFAREVAQNDVLTLTVDNSLNPAGAAGDLTCDALIFGYEVRRRTVPIDLDTFGQMR